jgi:hypothetical protein
MYFPWVKILIDRHYSQRLRMGDRPEFLYHGEGESLYPQGTGRRGHRCVKATDPANLTVARSSGSLQREPRDELGKCGSIDHRWHQWY